MPGQVETCLLNKPKRGRQAPDNTRVQADDSKELLPDERNGSMNCPQASDYTKLI